jgi:anti-anti-sigma factor
MSVPTAQDLATDDLGDMVLVRFTGPPVNLNEENKSAMARQLSGLAEVFAGRPLVLDLENVSFVSTSGLTMLLQFRKRVQAAGGRLRLANLQRHVREVFEITHLDSVFDLQTLPGSVTLA